MINTLISLWRTVSHATGDAALGWLMTFPRDVTLFGLSVLTTGLLILLRKWASDQPALACLQRDNRRLAERIRDARQDGARESLARYRKTRARVTRMRMLVEARLGLLSFIPVALLLSWGAARLPYLPLLGNESFEFVVTTPVSAVGEIIHLVPNTDITAAEGWIREVGIREQDSRPRGWASWRLHARRARADSLLTVRLNSRSIEHPVLIGNPRSGPSLISHGGDLISQVRHRPYKPLGYVPGLFGLAPWLVGYMVTVVALFYGAKSVLGLC